MKSLRKKVAAAAAVATAAVVLPLAAAGTASATTNLRPHWTASYLECQTLGNKLAQEGRLTGFNCVARGNGIWMEPW